MVFSWEAGAAKISDCCTLPSPAPKGTFNSAKLVWSVSVTFAGLITEQSVQRAVVLLVWALMYVRWAWEVALGAIRMVANREIILRVLYILIIVLVNFCIWVSVVDWLKLAYLTFPGNIWWRTKGGQVPKKSIGMSV